IVLHQLISDIVTQDADVHVSQEDQQKINKFARLNARLEDISAELKMKEKELQNLADAEEEVLLTTDAELIPYPLIQLEFSRFIYGVSFIVEDRKPIPCVLPQVNVVQAMIIMSVEKSCFLSRKSRYLLGEVYVHLNDTQAQEFIEKARKDLNHQSDVLKGELLAVKGEMGELKIQLYAKFGSNINLEPEEAS
ncbi:PFDN4, partial [Cordylochernes scorpioides]